MLAGSISIPFVGGLFLEIFHNSLYASLPKVFLLQYLILKCKCIPFFRMANERGLHWSQYSPVVCSIYTLPVPPLCIFKDCD